MSKVGFVSLGCPKALVDSERILTQLRAEGYEISPTYQDANLVVVNTCGFIDSAVEESLDAIGEALSENGKVIVTGCLGVKDKMIRDKFPSVLEITGPQQYESVMNAVHKHLPPKHDPFIDLVPAQGIKLTPKHYAYLKISEGCNHKCTFCIIPSMRGKLNSRPLNEVMNEAVRLKNAGVKELLIISQDTSAYGVDTKYAESIWRDKAYQTRFKDLVEALGTLDMWVRLHYVYPYPHVDEIIPLMAQGKILPYLDIPFQHASLNVLKNMKRPACTEDTLKRIQTWRSICPDLTIRSTFIVGFPGETEEDFEELLAFLDEAQLDRVGCFAYSPVEGAAANTLANPVPEEIKQERLARFMAHQAEISAAKLQNKIGKTMRVLVDHLEKTEDGDVLAIARSMADAPEIDGVVIITNGASLKPGQFASVSITDTDEHDLIGEALAGG
ncbi:MAG: 30S ribosomal protein S12 methylthiotransferase RimO [Gammaproteobacteria bacterium]|nr:30S ribosomal protein S12 methylthiotransferase RimO [Gammaproteobacteria bacterium]